MRKIVVAQVLSLIGMSIFCCAKPTQQGADGKFCDFVVKAPADRDFTILQLTDTQVIDSSQCRENTWGDDFMATNAPLRVEEKLYAQIRKLVEENKPDLITITGDIVYGRFDDSGEQLQNLVALMESLKTPWCPVFGNHDNESAKGVKWQCEQFENAEYCLFKKGTISRSNGNYSVGIMKGDKLIRVLYMMDSNGCYDASRQSIADGVNKEVGLTLEHRNWFRDISKNLAEGNNGVKVPGFAFFHISTLDFEIVARSVSSDSPFEFDLGNDYTKNWGVMKEKSCCSTYSFSEFFKEANIEACYVGHDHVNCFAIDHQGVKWVYGLKTGSYDYSPVQQGGLLITVADANYTVKPVFA